MLNCTNDYIDLLDTNFVDTNTTYNYIRVYKNREGFVLKKQGYTSNYSTLTAVEVNVSNSFFARQDCHSICICSLCFILVIVLIFNVVTEFLQKGGLFR